jgi:hypothetical protein
MLRGPAWRNSANQNTDESPSKWYQNIWNIKGYFEMIDIATKVWSILILLLFQVSSKEAKDIPKKKNSLVTIANI